MKKTSKNGIKKTPVAKIATPQIPSSRIPSDVLTSLERACRSGKWLFAAWRVEDGKVFLDRTASDFPVGDLDMAMRLIVENVQELKGG